jgi:ABC-type multidrug transport system fused ATPase/permease subunit
VTLPYRSQLTDHLLVGRTGAGKSSLALALLRAIPTTGKVVFDGMDISTLNLEAIRRNVSIIPQLPELLSGTLRENIDPLGDHDDAFLNSALKEAGLAHLKAGASSGSASEGGAEGVPPAPPLEGAAAAPELQAPGAAIANGVPAPDADKHEITLDTVVESGGSNFSQGQRQIIALARAFVRRSKILIMDEATAAIG